MEGNSFLQLPVNFHSNRWSVFRDFMFTVFGNVVSGKSRFKLDIVIRSHVQARTFFTVTPSIFGISGPGALKIRRKDVASGICKHPENQFAEIFRVTYRLKDLSDVQYRTKVLI